MTETMTAEVVRLREAIRTSAVRGRKTWCTGDVKRDILAYAKEQSNLGVPPVRVAELLGMKHWTLQRWLQLERRRATDLKLRGEARFVEVVAPESKTRSVPPQEPRSNPSAFLTVMCAGGREVRVPSGFDPPSLRQLLAALEVR